MQAESSAAASSSAPVLAELDLQLVAVYAYDIFDRRVIRLVMGADIFYYAWDGWEEAQEMVPAVIVPQGQPPQLVTRPINQFAWGEQLDELVAYRHGPPGSMADYYVAEGGAHCPSRVLDGGGNVVEVQEYDPYGKTTFFSGGSAHETSQIGNPFGWKGHRIDQETGLVYMRHRYYSTQWGRFVSQDALGTWGDRINYGNGYAYGGNRSLTISDRLGLQSGSQQDVAAFNRHTLSGTRSYVTTTKSWKAGDKEFQETRYHDVTDRAGFDKQSGTFTVSADDDSALAQALDALHATGSATPPTGLTDGELAAAQFGASFVPPAGEAMDLGVLVGSDSTPGERVLAGGSLIANVLFGGVLPNFGGMIGMASSPLKKCDSDQPLPAPRT